MIEIRNLTKRFGGFTAVDHLDLTVNTRKLSQKQEIRTSPQGMKFGFLNCGGRYRNRTCYLLYVKQAL